MTDTTMSIAADIWKQAHLIAEAGERVDQSRTEAAEVEHAILTATMSELLDSMPGGAVRTFDDIRALAWFAQRQMSAALSGTDADVIRNAVMRAGIAVERLATELNAMGLMPPSPEVLA